MAVNRGKQFEDVVRAAFEKVDGVSIDRLHDQTTGYKGSQNICDFIVYREPYEYYFECKSVHGASLPFSNITETQWNGLLEKSKIYGVYAGILCWFIDKDITLFFPIQLLDILRKMDDRKSIRYNTTFTGVQTGTGYIHVVRLASKKKRVFFDYDMEDFFNSLRGPWI